MNKITGAFCKGAFMLIVATFLFVGFAMPARAEGIAFTQEEKEYLSEAKVLKAVSIDGAAPLHYRDSKGEIKGIAVNVLKEIANMTGITVEYYLYESISDALSSDFDIAFGLAKEYNQSGISLSMPYLDSETVLFYNKSVDATRLGDKVYAGIKGGTLPEGVLEEQTIYFNNRGAVIDAVDTGRADYGFGNAYSVAFYTLQNGYENIFTIPMGKEDRAYCMGIPEENKLLLSIINKSIAAIDPKRMGTLILDVASQVERKVTFSIVLDAYWKEIFALIAFVMLLLTYSAFSSTRAKNKYSMENRRYKLLSRLSNEYLFEYQIKANRLEIAEKLHEKIDLDHHESEIKDLLKHSLKEHDGESPGEQPYNIRLPLNSGGVGTFRVLFSLLRDGAGRIHSIIGKLVDISEEEKEREQLISKSQLDGLTGLYNALTTKEAVIKSISSKDAGKTDAFLIMDCDCFKEINDIYGHLMGDRMLENIGNGLRSTFRQSDIIGRIGGDEFCVYMHDIPSVEFVRLRCKLLANNIRELTKEFPVDISIGIVELKEPIPYESLFKQADDALYIAKGNGGAQTVIYNKELHNNG